METEEVQQHGLFSDLSEESFLNELEVHSKFKQRSHDTHHQVHITELNTRLHLSLNLPTTPIKTTGDNTFTCTPNTSNTSKLQIVYLGNSMLERLKTTGENTQMGKMGSESIAWNAGCGGDKNENVLYRLHQGLYSLLKTQQRKANDSLCNIQCWVLASGTNNLHRKHAFQDSDMQSWKLLLQSCLRIAPRSRVLACDMFYRKDIPDEHVEASNELLKTVVDELNQEMNRSNENFKEDGLGDGGTEHGKVVWVEARHVIRSDMLVDHVHLNEEGYRAWDEVLWPCILESVDFEP